LIPEVVLPPHFRFASPETRETGEQTHELPGNENVTPNFAGAGTDSRKLQLRIQQINLICCTGFLKRSQAPYALFWRARETSEPRWDLHNVLYVRACR